MVLSRIYIATLVFLWLGCQSMPARTIRVGKDAASITEAIAKAKPYDTISVAGGIYYESNILINFPLTLIGIDNPIIDGGLRNSDIIKSNSSNFIISGFTLRNVGVSAVSDNAAIKISNSSYCKVENNTFQNAYFGVYLAKTKNSYILNNSIGGNNRTESRSGNGIHLWQCSTIVVGNNRITGHRDGIYLEFVSKSSIINNYSTKNLRYGLHFMFSDNCEYQSNSFIRNGAGVAVMYTKNITMTGNTFADNWGASSYGLLLKDIRDGTMTNNVFKNNTIGILAEGSNRIYISKNNFLRNGWAVKIMANCVDDVFTRNNFISNTFDVSTNGRVSYNQFSENYWSEYDGYDLNHDGFGDVPYHPVRLFSFLAAQNEPAIILLRSFFVGLLDASEKLIPSITPEALVDRKPLMSKIK